MMKGKQVFSMCFLKLGFYVCQVSKVCSATVVLMKQTFFTENCYLNEPCENTMFTGVLCLPYFDIHHTLHFWRISFSIMFHSFDLIQVKEESCW